MLVEKEFLFFYAADGGTSSHPLWFALNAAVVLIKGAVLMADGKLATVLFLFSSAYIFLAFSGSISDDVSTKTDSVCPSITGTRVHVLLTLMSASFMTSPLIFPSIFL